jgi:phosphoribosylglycinamide formyltransferase-1
MKSLGILLSGRGSNFVAIADSIDAGRIPGARIAVVIANKADAPGIATARQRGLKALVIPSKGRAREEHDREVVAALKAENVDLVCPLGICVVVAWFVQQFPQRNSQYSSFVVAGVSGWSAGAGVCLRGEGLVHCAFCG